MTKTISLELSKKLTEAGLLDNIETEYVQYINIKSSMPRENTKTNDEIKKVNKNKLHIIKLLTLEEAIELLPICITIDGSIYANRFFKGAKGYYIDYTFSNKEQLVFEGETLLDAIEKTLEYLLDNELLGTKQ